MIKTETSNGITIRIERWKKGLYLAEVSRGGERIDSICVRTLAAAIEWADDLRRASSD
jgi:hypothetical protein